MKLVSCAALPVLLFSTLLTTEALAEGKSKDGKSRVLTVYNTGKLPVIRFNASPSNSKSWGPDLMPLQSIRPGKFRRFDLDDGKGSCVFDLMAVFADGNVQVMEKGDICKAIAAGNGWMVSNVDN